VRPRLAAGVVLVALLAGCGSGESTGSTGGADLTGDAYPGIDRANTRLAKSEIDSFNVGRLKEAWSIPIEGTGGDGSYASTPVIANGVVYSQDLESNVQAIDLESGEILWSKEYGSASEGPNGLAVADGRVYGATASAAFALDQRTGKEVWLTPLNGLVNMAPGVDHGRAYVSTVPDTAAGASIPGEVGTLWAMDGNSGKKLWHWDTVPKSLWGKPEVNSGGGIRYQPSFDEHGFVYVGTGSPAPVPGAPGEPWGSSRPGPNLYADSMVKLDPRNGKLLWHYQQTPHDVYGWGFQNPPILTKVRDREVAIGSGGSGFAVAVDRRSGEVVWQKVLGLHNGHDQDGLYAMRGEYEKIGPGLVYPGQLGSVAAPLAADDEQAYVPIVERPMKVRAGLEISPAGSADGEVAAVDLATGRLAWETTVSAPVFGAPVIANDLVFVTTLDGLVRAFNVNAGGEVWQAELPAGTKAAPMVSGDTLVVGAGLTGKGQTPKLVAYRLGG
jgi:alcohol dehydrogenase (cytochrome c)